MLEWWELTRIYRHSMTDWQMKRFGSSRRLDLFVETISFNQNCRLKHSAWSLTVTFTWHRRWQLSNFLLNNYQWFSSNFQWESLKTNESQRTKMSITRNELKKQRIKCLPVNSLISCLTYVKRRQCCHSIRATFESIERRLVVCICWNLTFR